MIEMQKMTTKQKGVLDYVQKNSPTDQSQIVNHFSKRWYDGNKSIARVTISRILSFLRSEGFLIRTKKPNDKQGSLEKNVWSIKQ